MRKYRKGNSDFPCDKTDYRIEDLLRRVDEGDARLKASYDIREMLHINICPIGKDCFYSDRFEMTWEEFNAKYGKEYITSYNFYL